MTVRREKLKCPDCSGLLSLVQDGNEEPRDDMSLLAQRFVRIFRCESCGRLVSDPKKKA